MKGSNWILPPKRHAHCANEKSSLSCYLPKSQTPRSHLKSWEPSDMVWFKVPDVSFQVFICFFHLNFHLTDLGSREGQLLDHL